MGLVSLKLLLDAFALAALESVNVLTSAFSQGPFSRFRDDGVVLQLCYAHCTRRLCPRPMLRHNSVDQQDSYTRRFPLKRFCQIRVDANVSFQCVVVVPCSLRVKHLHLSVSLSFPAWASPCWYLFLVPRTSGKMKFMNKSLRQKKWTNQTRNN